MYFLVEYDVYSDIPWWNFSYSGGVYYIDDKYCVNPQCQCKEITMFFYKVEPREKPLESIFSVEINPELKWNIIEIFSSITEQEIDRIMKTFFEKIKNPGEEISCRTKKMKEFGKFF